MYIIVNLTMNIKNKEFLIKYKRFNIQKNIKINVLKNVKRIISNLNKFNVKFKK